MTDLQQQADKKKKRLKLVLAIVLTVTFVIVLIVQFGGSSAAKDTGGAKKSDDAESEAEGARRKTPAGESQDPPEPEVVSRPPVEWPMLKLETVLSYDPFAVPEGFPAVASKSAPAHSADAGTAQWREELLRRQAEQKEILEKLQQEGVDVIVGSREDGYVAVIGLRTVRVGDKLDGFLVAAIEPDGVVLRRPKLE